MAHNIITNANDVELIIKSPELGKRGTAQSMGRIVVDDFSITREEDDSLESGVGFRLPAGISNGDITINFSFTMTGDDVDTFEMVADSRGRSNIINITARKPNPDEDEQVDWEIRLSTCKATSEEVSASSGDPIEYAVEGIAVRMDKKGTRRSDRKPAWQD
jgi:hypothetical protein